MSNPIHVTDRYSNTEEQIERAVKAIGRGALKRAVFAEVYRHKRRVRNVSEISAITQIALNQVRQLALDLYQAGIMLQTRKNGQVAYEQIAFFMREKGKIFRLLDDPEKMKGLPTKRKAQSNPGVINVTRKTINQNITSGGGALSIGFNTAQGSPRVGSQKVVNAAPISPELREVLDGVRSLLKQAGTSDDITTKVSQALENVEQNPTKTALKRLVGGLRKFGEAVRYSDELSASAESWGDRISGLIGT